MLVCLVMLIPLKLYIYFVQLHKQSTDMKNVSISEFRANLLKYLTLVQQGEQINVTSKGNLMATLTPPVSQQDAARTKLRKLAKTAVIHDVIGPIEDKWDALK
jgi:antitoxin (DNA-binding transcriptional repressor) of toxin-antitoxin stability system